MSEMRKSRIRKAVVRKLNTAKYETIDIIVEHEHEVEWEDGDISSLMKKSDGVGKIVLKDYQETEGKVLEELRLSAHSAFGNDSSPKKVMAKDDFDSL